MDAGRDARFLARHKTEMGASLLTSFYEATMDLPSCPVSVIASILNLTERRIQQLSQEGVIPKNERGRYDLENSVRCYVQYLQDRANGQSLESADYHKERARLTKLQADEKSLLLEQLRGKLLTVEDVSETWVEMITNARAKLLSLPNKMAAQVTGLQETAEIEALLKTAIYEALTELANPYHEVDGADHDNTEFTTGDEPSVDATTGSDGESVGRSLPTTKS